MGNSRRVVVTGIGLVSSLGIGTEPNWTALCAGQSGIAPITKFDAAQFATRIAGEVKGFDPLRFIEKKDVKKMDVFIQYAIAASQFAMDDSGFVITPELGPRVGVFIASGIGGFTTIEREHKALLEGGPRKISPFFIPSAIINLAAGQVSIRYGAKGPNSATCTACSASAHAIGDAFEIIRRGDADVMIAGGSEAAITPMGIGGFGALRALSTRNTEPERASRPFDKDRDGFVVGEGAGVVILEEHGLALRRGARIYAELVGYGMSADAYHITAPSEDGDGPFRVMNQALTSAGIQPSQVDYINAHGTSTPHGDKVESIAIRRTFGGHADKLAVSSTKSMTGHLLGAAGGLEAGITVLADDQSGGGGRRMRSGLRAEPEARGPDCLRAHQFVRLRRHQRRPALQALHDHFMKIAVCIKQVPTRDWQPRLNDAKTWIREQDASYEMNEPDAYALEEALRLKEKHGGEVVVCSAGPARVAQVIREALARGADRAIHVEDDGLASADAFVIAWALGRAMKEERFDLILTGLQSDDQGFAQTGVVLAERLGLPHATIVMEVVAASGSLRVKRELEGGWFQWVTMPLPAVLTIQSGINQLRYATLKGIMAAKKKEIRKAAPGGADTTSGAPPPRQKIVSLYVPEKGKKTQIISGTPAEAATELVKKLREEARVF
jgi:3-oxoacyl-[acyl-carrier-protein] synthase II